MNSTITTTIDNNSNQQQEDDGHQSVVAAAAVAATMTTTQPMFCESPNKKNANRSCGDITRSPNRLTSLLSSPLFGTSAPPGIIESGNIGIVQDDGGEALLHPVEEKNEEAKAKPARVSIGGNDEVTISDNIVHRKAFFEGPFHRDGDGSVIEDNGDGEVDVDVDVEPHRKKQKKQLLGDEYEDELREEEECVPAEDDRFALAKAVSGRGSAYRGGGDDARVDQDNDAMAVPMILLEDVDDDDDDVDAKIRKWSRELLALKKEINDARVRT